MSRRGSASDRDVGARLGVANWASVFQSVLGSTWRASSGASTPIWLTASRLASTRVSITTPTRWLKRTYAERLEEWMRSSSSKGWN